MNKLKLDAEALRVESFVTDLHGNDGGTVDGFESRPRPANTYDLGCTYTCETSYEPCGGSGGCHDTTAPVPFSDGCPTATC
jgi:hypothetical protein